MNTLRNAYNKGISGEKKLYDLDQQTLERIVGNLNVDWSSYAVIEFPDSSTVVEFSMPDDTSLFVVGDQNLNNNNTYHSKTNAMFILHKDTLAMSFFMKTIENPSDSTYQSTIDQLHYTVIPSTFTGQVLYFTLDKQFINGYAWQNGILTSTVSLSAQMQTDQSPKLQTNSATLYCYNSIVYEVTEVTTDNPLVGSNPQTAQYQGTTTSYVYTPIGTVTSCDIVESEDFGSGGTTGTPGGVSGGGTTGTGTVTQNPCPNTASAYAKGQKLMVTQGCQVSAPPPANTTTTTPTITNSDLENAIPLSDGKPAIDPTKYINCFTDGKTAKSYKLTIYVAQPNPGHNDWWVPNVVSIPSTTAPTGEIFVAPGGNPINVGHTFVSFEKDNTDGTSVTQVMGFYPGGNGVSSPGIIQDDSGHPYNVSYTINVTASEFNAALAGVVQANGKQYILTDFQSLEFNCTDAARGWISDAGTALPIASRGIFLNTPGDFGQALAGISGSSTAPGSAPQGHGACP